MTRLQRLTIPALAAVLSGIGVGAAPAFQDPSQTAPSPPQQPSTAPTRAGRWGGGSAATQVPPAAANQTVQQVQQMFDALVLYRSQEVLKLTSEQYPVFFQKMQALQKLRIRHQQERRRLVNELAQLTRPQATTDEATLVARVKALDDLELQIAQEEQRAIAALDQSMTPYQRARFRVFEENMERQKLQMLAKALQVQLTAPADPGKSPIKKPQ